MQPAKGVVRQLAERDLARLLAALDEHAAVIQHSLDAAKVGVGFRVEQLVVIKALRLKLGRLP